MTSQPTRAMVPAVGEVIALLTPIQELQPGLYMLQAISDGWAVVREVIDDQAAERIVVTQEESAVPVALLDFFMPIGVRLFYGA